MQHQVAHQPAACQLVQQLASCLVLQQVLLALLELRPLLRLPQQQQPIRCEGLWNTAQHCDLAVPRRCALMLPCSHDVHNYLVT